MACLSAPLYSFAASFFTLIPIPPLALAAQIAMKKWMRHSLFWLYNSYREATLQSTER